MPDFTPQSPMNILVSGCLAGMRVGFDGSSYGDHAHIASLLALSNVRAVPFCPEDFAFGTPRAVCDIHGGDGHDVLAGRARVIAANGEDWTDRMLRAAQAMLTVAREHHVHVAILMDISAACGSQVIYDGARSNGRYQAGHGVCAALLIENGIPVLSQRDYRTLHAVRTKLAPDTPEDATLRDHHESDWYRAYFCPVTASADDSSV